MTWQAYRLVYQLKSNLLVGWHTLGYINLTRYYIPGKNMWASFTDNQTRAQKKEPGLAGYGKYGELLKDKVLLSYFYPAFNLDKPLLPRCTEKGLFYGNQPVEQFEKIFVGSVGKTAILPKNNAKEDGSLHEMEFLASGADHGGLKHLFFIGYLFVHQDAAACGLAVTVNEINTTFNELFIGGERKYGWGRLKLISSTVSDKDFFEHSLDLAEDEPRITLRGEKYLPAHTPVREDTPCRGGLETVVGRDWIPNDRCNCAGPGRRITAAKLCWVPGSQYCGNDDSFQIGEYGILKKL